MSTDSLPLFKLGVHRLPAAESVLVRTVLWLYGDCPTCRWIYADAPPYDVVLVDALDRPESLAEAGRIARRVLRLTGLRTEPDAHTLQRPIGAERLQQRLGEIAAAWLNDAPAETPTPSQISDRPAADEPTAKPSELTPPISPTPDNADTDFVPLEPAPALAPAPAMPGAEGQPPTQPAAPSPALFPDTEPEPEPSELQPDAPRQRLKRWPRAAILRGDPSRVRMAALLSRRALNAHDLMRITGFKASECQVFMAVLHASELLISDEQLAPKPLATLGARPSTGVARSASGRVIEKLSLPQSLIAGIRRRLGF